MGPDTQTVYDLIWHQENQFAHRVAGRVLQKPEISVWIILIPVLFLYYAYKIQQYKAAVHDFSKGLTRAKILALDSAKDEIESGRKNKDYQAAFVSKDLEHSPNVMRVRDRQIAEMDLLKSHYMKLLRHQESSYQDLIIKTYRTAAEYRRFLNQLAKAEEALNEAVLRAYHPGKAARDVTKRMQKAALAVREEEISAIFG